MAWREIGPFDAATFGKGYGEENDWCQRAGAKGYCNVLVPNLFVYHAHGASFPAEKRRSLIENNLRRLAKKWPNYFHDVGTHISNDPWSRLRHAAFLHLCLVNNPLVIIDHNIGGGANAYSDAIIKAALTECRPTLLLTYNTARQMFAVDAQFGEVRASFATTTMAWVAHLLSYLENGEVVYNDLVSWPAPLEVVALLSNWRRRTTGNRLIILFHDYLPICPSYNLLNATNEYCAVPEDLSECLRCLASNSNAVYKTDIKSWRARWGGLLTAADEVVCFSNSSAEIVKKAWELPSAKMSVRPHSPLHHFDKLRFTRRPADPIVIGVVGALTLAKGARIVSDISRLLLREQPGSKIVVLGLVDAKYIRKSKNLMIHGQYDRRDLPDLIAKYGINLGVVPSIWPETFSYVTQELIEIGIPLVSFDIGGQAEQVRKYGNGIVVDEITAEALVRGIIAFYGE